MAVPNPLITRSPERLSGAAVFAGTRVRTREAGARCLRDDGRSLATWSRGRSAYPESSSNRLAGKKLLPKNSTRALFPRASVQLSASRALLGQGKRHVRATARCAGLAATAGKTRALLAVHHAAHGRRPAELLETQEILIDLRITFQEQKMVQAHDAAGSLAEAEEAWRARL